LQTFSVVGVPAPPAAVKPFDTILTRMRYVSVMNGTTAGSAGSAGKCRPYQCQYGTLADAVETAGLVMLRLMIAHDYRRAFRVAWRYYGMGQYAVNLHHDRVDKLAAVFVGGSTGGFTKLHVAGGIHQGIATVLALRLVRM
jgi:hypothetical protein